MRRFARILLVLSLSLTACTPMPGTGDVDVTPQLGTGAVAHIDPPPTQRYEGRPTRIGFEPIVLEGAEFPAMMGFAFLPGDQEFLAVNKTGKVALFHLEREYATMIDSFQIPAVYSGGECGATSIELDPNFEVNRLFYVSYCIDEQYNVIKRYTMSEEDMGETLYTAAHIVATGDPKADSSKHPIGAITFGPDGVLWAGIGDRQRENMSQDLTNEMGKIIRLKPLRESSMNGYSLPDETESTDWEPKSPLIYAYGLRNPWRAAFDSRGRYWIADADTAGYQEINILTKAGQNFGWPLVDGLVCTVGSCATTVAPVLSWNPVSDHSFILEDPLAKAVPSIRSSWVGIEYRPGISDPYKGLLTGKMLYGDFYAGFVRGAVVGTDRKVVSDVHLGHIELPVAWRQRSDGYLYVATMYRSADGEMTQGQLWRVVPLP